MSAAQSHNLFQGTSRALILLQKIHYAPTFANALQVYGLKPLTQPPTDAQIKPLYQAYAQFYNTQHGEALNPEMFHTLSQYFFSHELANLHDDANKSNVISTLKRQQVQHFARESDELLANLKHFNLSSMPTCIKPEDFYLKRYEPVYNFPTLLPIHVQMLQASQHLFNHLYDNCVLETVPYQLVSFNARAKISDHFHTDGNKILRHKPLLFVFSLTLTPHKGTFYLPVKNPHDFLNENDDTCKIDIDTYQSILHRDPKVSITHYLQNTHAPKGFYSPSGHISVHVAENQLLSCKHLPASLHSSPDLSDQEAKERLTLIQTIQIEIPE